VAALAHREKLPETTAALSQFLLSWEPAHTWACFNELVHDWDANVAAKGADAELDRDRVGVFWALLFLCHQGKVELDQHGGLFGPLQLRRLLSSEETRQLPLVPPLGAAHQELAA
jgi:segregation and condensation protein A